VLLVLALILLLSAIAYPSLDSMFSFYKVQAAADKVRAAWAEAQAHAINEGRPYRFSVVPSKGNFKVAPDSSEFWGDNNSSSSDDNGNGQDQAYVMEDALPKGVRFAMNNDQPEASFDAGGDSAAEVGTVNAGEWNTVATFLPDGSARQDLVEVSFGARGTRSISLRLRGITGVVTMRMSEGEGHRP
jgi:Tfp pilus assembly protein FimT